MTIQFTVIASEAKQSRCRRRLPRNRRIRSLAEGAMRSLRLVLFCLLLPQIAAAATLGEPKVGFSADRVLTIDGHSYLGRIWAMPGEERHEQAIQAFRPIFLLHAASPLGEIVLPQLKTIVEFVMPPELRLFADPALTKHPVGHASVNGIATTAYAIDETVPEGHAQGTLWLSRDDIPMKLAGTFIGHKGKPVAVRWELNHVRVGPQPAALFETPRGFSKLPAEAIVPLLGLKLKSARR
jgi:hypothetical protein